MSKKLNFQMFSDEYPLYSESYKLCKSARFVGGVSKYLCECKNPLACEGVKMSQEYFEIPSSLLNDARKFVILYKDVAEDYMIRTYQAPYGLSMIKKACAIARKGY